jgi:aspartyl/glutamyl-tRNA(Asn/Gln) amidotransferase C subunit
LAELARLNITSAEADELAQDMEGILEYVSDLPEFQAEEIQEAVGADFRADEPAQPLSTEDRERLLSQFASREGDFLALKRFLDNDAV